MSKNKQIRGAAKGGPSPISSPPTLENVKEWVRKDLQSAHYLLGVVLMRHPELVAEIGEQVYKTVMRKEAGPAIDHVDKDREIDRPKEEEKGYAD